MINTYSSIIVDKLLDSYEKSKIFNGTNKVNVKIKISISKVFPEYKNHANYEIFSDLNETLEFLVRKGLVVAKQDKGKVFENVYLNLEELNNCYEFIGRLPKKTLNSDLLELLEKYKNKNEVLKAYCVEQLKRLEKNSAIEYFNNDLEFFENVLLAVDELFRIEKETFYREFSIRIFKDSKYFGQLESRVVNLIYKYGDFPTKEDILGMLNIVKNPTYVYFKGNGVVTINNQIIDVNEVGKDIGISSEIISNVNDIKINAKNVMTIENLTNFHVFNEEDFFVIYLGGYHNHIRRDFIKKIKEQNKEVSFFHFGDIDAGGFNILEHLISKTGVEFTPFKMDLETLKQYREYGTSLTAHDRKRLENLKNFYGTKYSEVINYMLEENIKLEQEAVNL